MWTLSRATRALIAPAIFGAALGLATSAAFAQTTGQYNPYPYNYTNQTYSYGLYLPQVPQPNGQDEIRAADGTTCRSSMASNDAYLDVGGIGGQGSDGSFDSGTVYGRIIVPLGGIPKRLDCSSLYNLEISRLKHELELMRAGIGAGPGLASAGGGKAWADTGWTDKAAATAAKPTKGQASSGGFVPTSASKRDGFVPSRLGGPETVTASISPAPVAAVPVPQHEVLDEKSALPAYAPSAFLTPAPPLAISALADDVEILPWSDKPAEGARVLTLMPAKRPLGPVVEEPSPARQTIPLF